MILPELRHPNGALHAWAWPGGYPLAYLTRDGDVVCPTCATEEVRDAEAWAAETVAECAARGEDFTPDLDAFDLPLVPFVNWEDASLYCESCARRIESAYAEDDAPAGPIAGRAEAES